jgi:hypothetical protein
MPSYPLTYPTNARLVPKSIDFGSRTIATQFQSPYTGKTQTYRYGGQWWELNLIYAPLFQTDAEELTGFLNALAGTSGTFTYKLPNKFMISASVGITTTATGNDFTLGSGTVEIGKYGYDNSSNRLVQFTTATSLFPKLSPSTSYTINTTSGTRMRLATNDIQFSVDEMMLTGIVVPIVEAI